MLPNPFTTCHLPAVNRARGCSTNLGKSETIQEKEWGATLAAAKIIGKDK
jgi:hypothetical protein